MGKGLTTEEIIKITTEDERILACTNYAINLCNPREDTFPEDSPYNNAYRYIHFCNLFDVNPIISLQHSEAVDNQFIFAVFAVQEALNMRDALNISKYNEDIIARLLKLIFHDLNNPLASIYGSIHYLTDILLLEYPNIELSTPDIKSFLLVAKNSVDRLRRLMENHSELLADTSGLLPTEEEVVSEFTQAKIDCKSQELNIEFSIDYEVKNEIEIPGIARIINALQQVLRNCVDHIDKSNPRIYLRIFETEDTIIIETINTGEQFPDNVKSISFNDELLEQRLKSDCKHGVGLSLTAFFCKRRKAKIEFSNDGIIDDTIGLPKIRVVFPKAL